MSRATVPVLIMVFFASIAGAQPGGTLPVRGTFSDNSTVASGNHTPVIAAFAQSNLPAAATAGNGVALLTDLNRRLLIAMLPSGLATYAASKQGLVPAATPTDIAVLPGCAGGTTVIVTDIEVSCTQTTAGIADLQAIIRSTADTGGTSAAMTIVKADTNNATACAVPLTYTANPTLGTTVGNWNTHKIGIMAPATASDNGIYIWRPPMGQSITLRGTAQQLAINLNSVTLTGGSCDINFQWIETTGL